MGLLEESVRTLVLLFTIISLIYILSHQPRPIDVIVLPYCEISTHLAYKDQAGRWKYRWVPDFGPCSLMDRYENV